MKMRMNNKNKGIKTMDLILIIVGVLLISFTITILVVFVKYGSIPDTLCTCVFAVLGGECGVMGWIRTTKDRQQTRKETLEDREHDEQLERNKLNE